MSPRRNHARRKRRRFQRDKDASTIVHRHEVQIILDRSKLTHEEYFEMLATPKGYQWAGMEAVDGRLKRTTRPKRKKIMEHPENEIIGDEFTQDIWGIMTPSIIQRLRNFLIGEFDMPEREADEFINSRHVEAKKPTSTRVEQKSVIDPGTKYKWVQEFSDVFSKRIEQYIVSLLIKRRTPEVTRVAEKIIGQLCFLTGENTTLHNPKTKVQKIMVLIADRLAVWVVDLLADKYEPHKYIPESEEKVDHEEDKEGEQEEEEEEEGGYKEIKDKYDDKEKDITDKREEKITKEEDSGKDENKEREDEPPSKPEEEQNEDEMNIEEEQPEDNEKQKLSEEKEDSKPELSPEKLEDQVSQKVNKEEPESTADDDKNTPEPDKEPADSGKKGPEPAKSDDNIEPDKQEETNKQPNVEPEQSPEDSKQEDEPKRSSEIIKQLESSEELHEPDKTPESPVPTEDSTDNGDNPDLPTVNGENAEEPPVSIDKDEEPTALIDEPKQSLEHDKESEEPTKLTETPEEPIISVETTEEPSKRDGRPESTEKPEESTEDVDRLAEPTELDIHTELEKGVYPNIFDLIKEDIAGTEKGTRTDRQKQIKDAIDKRIDCIIGKGIARMQPDDVDDAVYRVAHWVEQIMEKIERSFKAPLSPGPAFEVNKKTGSTLRVQKLSSGTVADKTAQVRGVEPPHRPKKILASESPMRMNVAQEWVDWATNVADKWGQRIDHKITDAEKQVENKNKDNLEGKRDWKQWRDQVKIEAHQWRVEKDRVTNEGKIWEKKLGRRPLQELERELRSTDLT